MKMKPSSPNSSQFGCISTILRRFLSHNKVTHNENCTEDNDELSTKETNSQCPSIVARLMGLDSMPVLRNCSGSDSLTRSRSANSIESCPGFLSERNNQASPAWSSVSFREKPTYLREENDEFLLLSFSPDENEDDHSRNREKRCVEKKKRRNRRKLRRVKREEILERCDENGELPLILDLEKFEFKQCNLETDCSSDNSSPVSVLDPPDTPEENLAETNSSECGRQNTQKKQNSSRRKLSSNFETFECPDANEKHNESRRPEMKFGYANENCRYICKFVESDLKNSIWVEKELKSSRRGEEIAIQIGFEILNQLLVEETYEFSCSFVTL